MYKKIISCIYNDSIDIIPHCVILFCTKSDICDIVLLTYNFDLHQIYKLDVFVHTSVPVLYCMKLWVCLKNL